MLYKLTVTATNGVSMKSATTSMLVYVLQSTVVAVIAGGATQSVRVFSILSVDASGSYDNDQVNDGKAGLTYFWTCSQSVPVYSTSCSFSVPSEAFNSSQISTMVDSISSGSQSTFTVTVRLGTRQAVASTLVTVIAPP